MLGVLAGAQGEDVVVSLGGGSVLAPRVRAALTGHTTVLLDVPLDVAWSRAAGRDRPLARDRDAFAALYDERQALYASLADAHLPQGDRGMIVRADGALRALACAPEGTRMAWAAAASGEYPVFVGRGVLALAGLSGFAALPGLAGRTFCVTDEEVVQHHLAPLSAGLSGLIEIGSGETYKTLESCQAVWHAMVEQGVTRSDHLLALGGGVVGDLAGFCAATYQRGMPVVQAPTTTRGPGRLGLRRQDGRRPPGGQELRRRLSPACRGPGRHHDLGHAVGGRVRRRLRRGRQDRADRRRSAVGHDRRWRPRRRRRHPGLRPHQARGRRRRRARRRPPAGPQPRPHRRPRAGGRPRLRHAAPWRGRRPRPARRAAAERVVGAARPGRDAAGRRGLADEPGRPRRRPRGDRRRDPSGQEAHDHRAHAVRPRSRRRRRRPRPRRRRRRRGHWPCES